ncbi:MAG: flagellar hook-associated protein FlgK [Desulfovibrio sp.]|nr:flagellar hook-associated protein FlgK [Desulfovibrio sp.]
MLSNLLTIGKSALNSAQAWVNVTGDNIANADTAGYTRRYVVQKEASTITVGGNQIGLGSNAEQVLRYFDKFLEDSYIGQSTISSRWTEYDNIMGSLESVFNEANSTGLSDTLFTFLNSWQKLALNPEDPAVRTSILTNGETVGDMFRSKYSFIKEIQDEMDVSITKSVERVNEISKAIATLNQEINETTIAGMISPNNLLDERDLLVEELATLVDIKTVDGGAGNYRVQLGTGQPLVDGLEVNRIVFNDARGENRILPESTFAGQIAFSGADDFEYTVEVTQGGEIGGTTPPKVRVSLDGGKTWIKGDDGETAEFEITGSSTSSGSTTVFTVDPIRVKDLFISFSFDADTSGNVNPSTADKTLSKGDTFDIVPKKGLYWDSPTRGLQNITPQITTVGTDNPDRVTGGKLASYFSVRDDASGRYLDELDALATSLIWEVNHLYSQGAGLTKLTQTIGQIDVPYSDQALGKAASGNIFYDKVQSGTANIFLYDSTTGETLSKTKLSFSTSGTDVNFDPETHTLADIAAAFNRITVDYGSKTGIQVFDAEIQNNRLSVKIHDDAEGITFAFGEDSSGLLAALGLNSFFSGSSAQDLQISTDIGSDYTKVNAGRVNGEYEVNQGDNTIATAIGGLSTKAVTINTFWKTVSQSLPDYYASLVSTVGSDKLHSQTNKSYHTTLTSAMLDQKEALTGVNLDEEMTNLVKYQSAYTAAAKLITTADEMLGVLIGLKQ